MPAPPQSIPRPPKIQDSQDVKKSSKNNNKIDDNDKNVVTESENLPPWAKITLTSAEAEVEKLIVRNELKDAEVMYFCQVEPILQDGPQ